MSSEVTKYSVHGFDVAAHERKIRTHIKNVTHRTVDRGIVLGVWFFRRLIDNKEFRTAFRSESTKVWIEYISKVTPACVLFLFKDSWGAVSFPFIFHDRVRENAKEDKLRLELKKFAVIATSAPLYDFYLFCLQVPLNRDPATHNTRTGRKQVAANYLRTPTWGPLARMGKSVGQLPTSARIEMKKKVTRSKIVSNLPDPTGWGEL